MQIARKMLIGLVLGAAVVGSIGSVAAQTDEPSESPSAEVERAPDGERRLHFRGGPSKHSKAVRSTAVLEPEEEGGEFRTVQSYSGILESAENCGRRFRGGPEGRFGPGMVRPGDGPATEESSAAA